MTSGVLFPIVSLVFNFPDCSNSNNDKMVNTYYNNSISEDAQNESFTKTLKDKKNTYEQIGVSVNKADWNVKEYHNNNCNKQYIDAYGVHNFDKCITDCIPSLTSLNENEKFLKKYILEKGWIDK